MAICAPTQFTSSVNCCWLSVLCGDKVVKEFDLTKIRVIDRDYGHFIITDYVSTFEFNELNTFDLTADEIRALRCGCQPSVVEGEGAPDYETANFTLLCDTEDPDIYYLAFVDEVGGAKTYKYISMPDGVTHNGLPPSTAAPCKPESNTWVEKVYLYSSVGWTWSLTTNQIEGGIYEYIINLYGGSGTDYVINTKLSIEGFGEFSKVTQIDFSQHGTGYYNAVIYAEFNSGYKLSRGYVFYWDQLAQTLSLSDSSLNEFSTYNLLDVLYSCVTCIDSIPSFGAHYKLGENVPYELNAENNEFISTFIIPPRVDTAPEMKEKDRMVTYNTDFYRVTGVDSYTILAGASEIYVVQKGSGDAHVDNWDDIQWPISTTNDTFSEKAPTDGLLRDFDIVGNHANSDIYIKVTRKSPL